jgi:CDP-diacylglycerol--serine O-phosphatidyltransferase
MRKRRNNNQSSLHIPIYKLFPNIITIIGLCLGVSAVRYALDFKMQIAAALIIVAAFLDGLDGRIARLLNSTSNFGAQLDSLADIVSFGVAPSVVVYIWSLHEIPYRGVGWAVVLFYVTCSALRLARFNVQSNDKTTTLKAQYYFTGIPMPSAAGITILPMISTFELLKNVNYSPWFVAIYIFAIGLLMVSNVPTFAFKKVNVKREYVMLLLVLAALLIVSIILEPWLVLPFVGLFYIAMIPISIFHYFKYFQSKINLAQ